MNKTTLASVNGFTPVLDHLVVAYGPTTALVFGRVWRFCQGEHGRCYASERTIAESLGMSWRTVHKHLKVLVGAGYLRAEKRPGTTTEYFDTGKGSLTVALNADPMPTSALDADLPLHEMQDTPALNADEERNKRQEEETTTRHVVDSSVQEQKLLKWKERGFKGDMSLLLENEAKAEALWKASKNAKNRQGYVVQGLREGWEVAQRAAPERIPVTLKDGSTIYVPPGHQLAPQLSGDGRELTAEDFSQVYIR
jgi:predicted transcriptional regulator